MSIYLLLNKLDRNYDSRISELSADAHTTFTPIVNNLGTQAIIQIKDSSPIYKKWMIERIDTLVLDAGDEAWLRTVAVGPAWDREERA